MYFGIHQGHPVEGMDPYDFGIINFKSGSFLSVADDLVGESKYPQNHNLPNVYNYSLTPETIEVIISSHECH